MKRSIFYSALALASMPTLTTMALEVDIPTTLSTDNWRGADWSNEGSGEILVSTGAEVYQYVGQLVNGEYVVKMTLRSDGDVTVNVVNKNNETKKTGTFKDLATGKDVTLNVKIEDIEELTVKVVSASDKAFYVSDFDVNLDFDFDTYLTALQNQATDLTNDIDKMGYTKAGRDENYENEELEEMAKIKAQITDILSDPSYAKYVENKLYLDADNNEIAKKMSEVKKNAEEKENKHCAEVAQENADQETEKLGNVTAVNDNVLDADKDAIDAEKERIEGLISAYEQGAKDAEEAGTAAQWLKDNESKLQEIKDAIAALDTQIQNANTAGDENKAAVDGLQANIDAVKNAFNAVTSFVQTNLVDNLDESETYLFADWLATSKLGIEDEVLGLDKVAEKINIAQAALNATKGAAAPESLDLPTVAEVNAIQTYWDNKVKAEVAAYADRLATINALQERIDAAKNDADFNNFAPNHKTDLNSKINAAQTEVTKLLNQLNAANAHEKHTVQSLTLNTAAADANVSKVTNAYDIAKNSLVNYNNVKAALEAITDPYNATRATVDAQKSKDGKYEPKNSYDKYESDLDKKITAITKTINDAWKNLKKETTYNTNPSTTEIESLINEYVANADKTVAHYDELEATLTAFSERVTAVENKVKDLAIYERNVSGKDPYKDQIAAVNTLIQNEWDNINNTINNNKGEDHWTKVLALVIGKEADIEAAIKAMEDNWSSDNDNYTLVSAQEARQAIEDEVAMRQENLKNAIDQFKEDYTEEVLGKQYADIMAELANIEGDKSDLDTKFAEDKTADPAKPEEAIVELKKDLETIKNIQEALEELTAKAGKVADDVTANNDALDAYYKNDDTTIFDLLEAYDKVVNGLNGTNGTAKDVFGDFTTEFAELKLSIETLETNIKASHVAETLVADESKKDGYKDQVTKLTSDLNALKDKVNAAETTYGLYLVLTNKYNEVKGTGDKSLSAAQTKAQDADATAWEAYYKEVFEGFSTRLAAIDIKSKYSDFDKDEDITKLTEDLKNLQEEYLAIDAKANKDAYDAQVAALQAAQDQWNETNLRITGTDETSKLQAWKDKLTEYQKDIDDFTTQVEEAYAKGESAGLDVIDKIKALEEKIKSLDKEQDDGYIAAVIDDNEQQKSNFNNAQKGTNEAYDAAVAEVDKYKGLQYETLADIIDPIFEAYIESNDGLYSYPEKLKELDEKAQEDYDAAQEACGEGTPTFYDKEGADRQQSIQYKKEIEKIMADFQDAVQKALDDAFKADFASYISQIKDELTFAKNNYTNKDNQPLLKALRTLVTEADNARKESDVQTLDKKLQEIGDFSEKLAEAVNQTAKNDLDPRFAKAETALAEYMKVEGVDTSELQDYYNSTIGVAKSIFDNNPDNLKNVHSDIVSYINKFYDKDQNPAEIVLGNKAAFDAMTAKVASLEELLKQTYDAVSDYYVVEDMNELIDAQAAIIENLMNGVTDDNAKSKQSSFNATATYVENQLKAIQTTKLIDAEYAFLKSAYNQLQAEYNIYSAAVLNDPDATDEAKAKIDSYKEAIDKVLTDIEKAKKDAVVTKSGKTSYYPEKLLALESVIADLRAQLSADNADNLAALIEALNSRVEELEGKATFDAFEAEEVGEQFGADLEAITTALSGVKDAVGQSETDGDVAFWNDKFNQQLDAIDADLDALLVKAEALNNQIVVQDASFAALNAEIEALQQELQDARDLINGDELPNVSVDRDVYWDDWYAQNEITYISDNVKARYDNKQLVKDEVLATNYRSRVNNVNSEITSMKNYAAYLDIYREYNKSYIAYNSAVNQVLADGSYNEYVLNSINRLKGDISSALSQLYSNNYNSRYHGTALEDHAVRMSDIEAINADIEKLLEFATMWTLGDANHNGIVNVTDYYDVIDAILSDVEEGSDQWNSANVKDDDKLNIADAQAIINLILYGEVEHVAGARGMSASSNVEYQVVKGQGTTERIAINLDGDNSFASFQLDVMLPAGMEITGQQLTSRSKDHIIFTSKLENGAQRIIVSSFKGEAFAAGSGSVLYLDVETNGMTGAPEFENVVFSDINANAVELTIGAAEATGINGINAEDGIMSKIYNVGGRLMDSLRKGINIIRGNDGTAKKVVK